jgi:Trk-type K+ transport system membrane component
VTAVRLVLVAVLGAVLLLAFIGAMLLAQFGPQNWPLIVWLLAVCAVIVGAGLGMSALQPEGDGDG